MRWRRNSRRARRLTGAAGTAPSRHDQRGLAARLCRATRSYRVDPGMLRCTASCRPYGPFGLYLALVELPGLDDGHQVVRMLQQGDVGEGIAVDDEQVRPLPGFDGSRLGRDPE